MGALERAVPGRPPALGGRLPDEAAAFLARLPEKYRKLTFLQVKENIKTLLDNSDLLRLEEHQISQLHKMLGRVKILLEWKRPSPQS